MMRKEKRTFLIIQKSKSRGFSLLDQKVDPIRKKYPRNFLKKYGYLTGPLSQVLQIFRIQRSFTFYFFAFSLHNQNYVPVLTLLAYFQAGANCAALRLV